MPPGGDDRQAGPRAYVGDQGLYVGDRAGALGSSLRCGARAALHDQPIDPGVLGPPFLGRGHGGQHRDAARHSAATVPASGIAKVKLTGDRVVPAVELLLPPVVEAVGVWRHDC